MKIIAGLLSALMASNAYAVSGMFVSPQGPVQLEAADGTTTILSHRAELPLGAQIQTGSASAALVTLSDGSKLLLSPNAKFKVSSSNTNETNFDLAAGKLKAYFAGIFSGRLKIHTPTAICAVRGTEFELSADGQKGTDVTVDEGHLEVSDNQGRQTVVTSEETLNIGSRGMIEPPHMVPLNSENAQAAARPFAVQLERSKSGVRTMIEDQRNRELKANEEQLGKTVIDAFGNRVRIEEYLLRPSANSFEVLFLNQSKTSGVNYGNITETFNSTLPNNPSQFSSIVSNTFFSPTMPSNYLTNVSFMATNTIDKIVENIALGAPTAISFAGYGLGTLYYPVSQTFTQTFSGPGVPGGSREQFLQQQDFGQTSSGLFTFTQSIIDNTGTLQQLDKFQLDPTSVSDVQAGGCSEGGMSCIDHSPAALNAFSNTSPFYDPTPNFASFNTSTSYPGGPSQANLLETTTYGDGSTISVEKFLVSNSGSVLNFANAQDSSFSVPGNYNMEDDITSSMFQGRSINVVIAPEILAQTSQAGAAAGTKTFTP